jgi:hypothetical protein
VAAVHQMAVLGSRPWLTRSRGHQQRVGVLWTWAGLVVLSLVAAVLIVVAELRIEDSEASKLEKLPESGHTSISAAQSH